jgi:hypothetical protein
MSPSASKRTDDDQHIRAALCLSTVNKKWIILHAKEAVLDASSKIWLGDLEQLETI